MRTTYRAPWDFLLISITVVIVAILLSINYLSSSLLSAILTWGIILGTAAFGVYGYSIQNGSIRILRLGWSKDVAFENVESIEIKPHAMSGSLRLWGIGGVFGYIGYFKNRVLGNYKAYATHRRKTVVICTRDFEQIVISPDNPEEFVQTFEEARLQGSQSDSINREKIAAD